MRRIYRFRSRALLDSLAAIGRAGTRLPALTVAGYRVGYAPSNGRLYVTFKNKPLGSVSASGIFRPKTPKVANRIHEIQAVIENTVEVVKAVSLMTEPTDDVRCAICGIPLSIKDRARGIGPKCWEKGLFNTYERRAIAGEQRRVKIGERERRARRV